MTGDTIVLDVRPVIRAKKEPFQIIMEAVDRMQPEDTLILHAPFKPEPLLKAIYGKGFNNEVTQHNEEHWSVRFFREDGRL
jgi:uncharacterized protein (DUF2249 family)